MRVARLANRYGLQNGCDNFVTKPSFVTVCDILKIDEGFWLL
jgi:hypothetical protein